MLKNKITKCPAKFPEFIPYIPPSLMISFITKIRLINVPTDIIKKIEENIINTVFKIDSIFNLKSSLELI
jgi:hypothetical protein